MKNVHPSEVQVIFALTMLKTEKEVTIMSFTDDRNKLKPVAWTSETSYEKAMEIFEADIVSASIHQSRVQIDTHFEFFRKKNQKQRRTFCCH